METSGTPTKIFCVTMSAPRRLRHVISRSLTTYQTAKIRPTDYAITERHVTALIRNLSENKTHDCLDQIDRFSLDVVSEVFFGESTDTLSAELQPLRDAVEEMYVWNTRKMMIGYVYTHAYRGNN